MQLYAPFEIIGEGQPQLAIVTPSNPLAVNAKDIAREMGITTCVVLTGLDEETSVAREILRQEQIQVIAGRGRLVYQLRKEVNVPVLAVEYSAQDILEALLPLQGTNSHIGHLCYPDQGTESEGMARLLGIGLTRFVIQDDEDIDEALMLAAQAGITQIIGGPGLVRNARGKGFEGIILQSGNHESLRKMFREAACVIALDTRNYQQMEMIRCISNLNPNAVLSINQEYKITYANSAAQKILGNSSQSIVGYQISNFLPHADCTQFFLPVDEQSDTSFTTNILGNNVIIRRALLSPLGKFEGAVLSIQDINELQRVERNIRQKIYADQHIAHMSFHDIVGDSPIMIDTLRNALRFSRTSASILLTGETGTGKDMFAQAIHLASGRAKESFVSVNCAALPESLLESELFGYEEGAFTGARRGGKAGLFELAHGGSLFLDEIGEMPLSLQTKLLRALQDQRVMRLGSHRLLPVNVRIITATNRDIGDLVSRGLFRDDLFYRINTLMLHIPPLRERFEDISRLAEIFIQKYVPHKPTMHLTARALGKLQARPWYGNVRELAHVIERAVILCDGYEITPDLIVDNEIRREQTLSIPAQSVFTIKHSEEETIRHTLIANQYHKGRTAKVLGISRATLWRKLRELNL